MTTLHAIILAAGQGTRMKSQLPKVLHPICGKPMIAYALEIAAFSGVKQPVVVLSPGSEQIKEVLPKDVKVATQSKPLGTGHAVLAAKKSLSSTSSGHTLILYADTPMLRRTTIQKLIQTHVKSGATCTLLTAHLADPTGYGRIMRNEHGRVVGIVEEADAHVAERAIREINIGPMIVKTSALFNALDQVQASGKTKEVYLTKVINLLGEDESNSIQVAHAQEVWEALGVNSRAELAKATGIIRKRIIETHLKSSGVTIEDPETTYIDHGVTIGNDTVIRPCSVIESGVTIGKRCVIGPFAHLRDGVTVGDDTKVGNFAELVRTKLGSGVRMNHVSYLGDAKIGDNVNIGAGTITANYDGKNKNETEVGKGAFIGSDTVLIAPVKVGKDAVTGAGSVVTSEHNVPPRTVVAGVPARALSKTDSTARNGSAAAKSEAKPKSAKKPADKKSAANKAATKKSTVKRKAATKKTKKKTTRRTRA